MEKKKQMINLKNKTAKISTTKISAIATALFLILIMAGSLMFVPTAKAATTNIIYYQEYAYASVSPLLVGVGQSVLLVGWTADTVPDVGETAELVSSPTTIAGWDGLQMNVTEPNGQSVLLAMPRSDPVGSDYISYTPDQVGTYYIQYIFPATWKNSTNPTNSFEAGYPNLEDEHYSAAVSGIVSFTVQSNPIQSWPETPLPNGYWTLPINGANRNWYTLAGDWLAGASGGGGASISSPFLQPQGTFGGVPQQLVSCYGPTSAHILWTQPYYMGGLMESSYESISYMTAHYTGLSWTGVIILDGKMYYSTRNTNQGTSGYDVADLYTGQILNEYNQTKPAFGQVYNYESPNQHGGEAYLWRTSGQTIANPGGVNGTVWTALDPETGQTVYQIANVSASGTQVYGLDGSIEYYNVVNYGTTTNPNYHLTIWNSSAIPTELAGTAGTNYWEWRPAAGGGGKNLGGIYVQDGNNGFSLNVSIPNIMGPANAIVNQTGTIRAIREGQYVIVGTAGQNNEIGDVQGYLMAISLAPGQQGTMLWKTLYDEPYAPTSANATNTLAYILPEQDVFVCGNVGMQGGSKSLVWYGYDMTTGKQIWQSDPMPQFQYYVGRWDTYDGLLIQQGYSGVLLAYNATTGQQAWNYTAQGIGFESPYGNYPIGISCIANSNGLIYTTGSEHSPTQPLWRGDNLRCINATDGTEVWSILFWGAGMSPTDPSNVAMADGILVGLNYFDNELYAFGKGPSATTVSAPQIGAVAGSPLTVTGTVTDQTATGRRNTNGDFDFTLKGTPAISDADQSAWMEYMFMQQAMPTNATGVPVSLDAIDPNGNYIHIGDVTSNIAGTYGCMFTPQVPGMYQITATFAGSNSYGPSFSETYLTAVSAPAATAAPTATPTSVADTYFVPAIAA